MIAKLLCLWLFLGAYKFWKRGAVSEWRKLVPTEDLWGDGLEQVADGLRDVRLKSGSEVNFVDRETEHRRLSGPAEDDSRLRWISSSAHGKTARIVRLLPLLMTDTWIKVVVTIQYNTIQLYCLYVEKFAFWLVIYIKTFNTVNNIT